MDDFAIMFQNFGRHGWSNINSNSKESPKHWIVVRIRNWFVPKHYPLVEAQLTELTNVGSFTRQYSFGSLTL